MVNKVIVFDLDDTLISEYDYLVSAYKEIADKVDGMSSTLHQKMIDKYNRGENVFEYLINKYPNNKIRSLLGVYRNHNPSITLKDGAIELLRYCKSMGYIIGLITDGRSITQRNKIKATKLEPFFDEIVISEEFGSGKPDERNYKVFDKYNGTKYYVADNTNKDFVTPNRLGWTTICLKDDGKNIHEQSFDLENEYLPKYVYESLHEIKMHLEINKKQYEQ